ncbi:unnamed protein product [Candidula unifasciata]|uniref:Uncharacterized protein n=1 Tax=Candidula unifasciata TaxID=100452 RepID=A0A8S3ZMA3_9EUPU|nr:unnamed protein product [Candidula unifasciata]
MDKRRINFCVHIRKKYFGEDNRPSTGMGMIVFAIPLLIPGIVITAVAFQDETGFSRFSALHVFGMVLLGADILLLIAGIALCVRFQSKVVPDDALQVISSHRKIRKEVNMDTVTTMSHSELPQKGTEFSAQCCPSIPPVNYFLNKDHKKTNPEQSASTGAAFSSFCQKEVAGAAYSKTSLDNNSSSDESYDSDDCFSGSYIVNETIIADRTTQGIECERDTTKVPKTDFRNIATTVVISELMRPNNFFQSSKTDSVLEIQENVSNKLQHSTHSTTVLKTRKENMQHEISSHINDHTIVSGETPNEVKQASDIHNTNCSPLSRRRLLGFSSESVLTLPKTPLNPDISPVPSRRVLTQHTLSLEENIADSRSSVFSVATELQDLGIRQQGNIRKTDDPLWCSERKQNSFQPAVRPVSFPSQNMKEHGRDLKCL